jgi:membrane-associated phospholipid phosphatase
MLHPDYHVRMDAAPPDALTRVAVEVAEDEPAPVKRELVRIGGLRALDASLLLVMNRLPHNPTSDRDVALLSDLGRGVGWAVLCAVLAWRDGDRGRRTALRTIAAMLTANYIAQNPMKQLVGRRRPFHDVRDHIVVGKRTLDTSFPSGHSASSAAAATSLALAYPRWAGAFLLAALGVGFSRVYLGHHYPSDVAGGIAVGGVIGAAAAVVA